MNNLLLLYASPHKEGISRQIITLCGLEYIEPFYIYDHIILPCIGCHQCKEKKSCIIQNDSMPIVYQKIQQAETILILSPIYFLGPPAPFKALIDRTQVFYYHPLKKEKKGIVIYYGEKSNQYFLPFYEKNWHYIFENWGVKQAYFFLFGKINNKQSLDLEIIQQIKNII